MRTKYIQPLMVAALLVAAVSFAPSKSNAQTENIGASVVVLNALTIAETSALNFGTVAVISDGTQTATIALDAVTAALVPTTTGAPAIFASVDNALATAAGITIADGADGASINYTINVIAEPINGGNAFTLNGFETSYNGGAVISRTIATPFAQVFSSAFGGGVNTLAIGAALVTKTTVATYADAPYAGSFDVVVSY